MQPRTSSVRTFIHTETVSLQPIGAVTSTKPVRCVPRVLALKGQWRREGAPHGRGAAVAWRGGIFGALPAGDVRGRGGGAPVPTSGDGPGPTRSGRRAGPGAGPRPHLTVNLPGPMNTTKYTS